MKNMALAILAFYASLTWAATARAGDSASAPPTTSPGREQPSGFDRSKFQFPDKRPFTALNTPHIAPAKQRASQYGWASAILRDILYNANSAIAKPWPVDYKRNDPGV